MAVTRVGQNNSAAKANSKTAAPARDAKAAASKPKKSSGNEASAGKTAPDRSRDDIRLSFLIHDVSRMRRAAYNQFIKPLGITREKWWVLANLSRSDGMMQTQLADVLEVGKASLGDVIGSLESAGLVARRADPADKRAKRVFLTPLAQSLIKRMTAMEVQFNDRVFGKLPPGEREKLFETLLTIKHSIAQFSAEQNAE
jgi:DNA-binding MarR family transcriptional regulator